MSPRAAIQALYGPKRSVSVVPSGNVPRITPMVPR